MNRHEGAMGAAWPDLAPPPEAVHLFHSYEDLKAQLLPDKSPPQRQTSLKYVSPTDPVHAADGLGREVSPAAALPPKGPRNLLQLFSKSFSLSGDPAASPCTPITRSPPAASSCRNEGPMDEEDRLPAVLGAPLLTPVPTAPSGNIQETQGVCGIPQTTSSQIDEGAPSPTHTQSDSLPTTNYYNRDEGKAQQRTRSTEAFEGSLVKSRDKKENVLFGGEHREDSSDIQDTIPPEVECLLLRLQHRSYSTGTAAPFSWRRARERASAIAAAARSNSSSSCAATEGNWKFDGDMLVPGDQEKTKALRQEALKRVRQRAREARERQQQELLQQRLEQEQQQQRSQALSKQLRQRTLQRIRENALKQEEERQQQELLQQQMKRQAEVQRQYCARHRKALQQRLLQQQQEIKEKIRMHAEESVRQSRDAKERIAAEVAAFRRRTVERLQVIEGPLKALMRLREARRLRNEFLEV